MPGESASQQWQRDTKQRPLGFGVIPCIGEPDLQGGPKPVKREREAAEAAYLRLAAVKNLLGRQHIRKVTVLRAGTSGWVTAPADVALRGITVVPERECEACAFRHRVQRGAVKEVKGLPVHRVARQRGLYLRVGRKHGPGAGQQRQEASEGVHPGAWGMRNLRTEHD